MFTPLGRNQMQRYRWQLKFECFYTVPHSHSLARYIFNTQSIPIHPHVLSMRRHNWCTCSNRSNSNSDCY